MTDRIASVVSGSPELRAESAPAANLVVGTTLAVLIAEVIFHPSIVPSSLSSIDFF
jgi:hypothetical protein